MNFLQKLLGGRPDAPADAAWQTPVVQAICVAMIEQIPEDWDSATLVLEPTENGLGSGLSHSAITPNAPEAGRDFTLTSPDFVLPNAEVMAATRQLELGWVERNASFKRAIISAVRDGENWTIKSDYEH